MFTKPVIELWLIFLWVLQLEGSDEDATGMAGYGVWYSENEILDIFNQSEYLKIPTVRATVATYKELLSNPAYDPLNDPPLNARHPFIAIEGTHRDSRIIIGKEVASYLMSTYLGNPPRSMVPLRKQFDKEKGMLRKAYFSLCMYVGAHHVRETWTKEAVVTTGYWLDQAAFSIAQRFGLEDLPTPDSPLYQWPEDLVKPDVAFFLNIPTLKGSMRPPNKFKPKLAEVYRRMRGIKVIEINQTGTYRKIFAIIRTHLQRMFTLKTYQREEEEEEQHYGKYTNKGDDYGSDYGKR